MATETQEREEWLRSRDSGIGGSEAAALFGVHPWASRMSVWLAKTGQVREEKDSPALRWGRRLEPVVREAYKEEVGRVVGPGVVNARHPQVQAMIANTDGTIEPVPEFDGLGVYEGKTSTVFKQQDWRDGVPEFYAIQLQQYLAVTGHKWGSICVLMMGAADPLLFADVPRNDRFIEALTEEVDRFWRVHVQGGVPPEIDGHRATRKAIELLHPKDNGEIVVLPDDVANQCLKLGRIKNAIKLLKEKKDTIENRVRYAIGPASYGVLPDGSGFAYKHQSRASFVVKAKEIRAMRGASKKQIDKARRDFSAQVDAQLEAAGIRGMKV